MLADLVRVQTVITSKQAHRGGRPEAEKVVKAATYGSTKASYYKWSPSALDVDRMKEHELYHSAPFRH